MRVMAGKSGWSEDAAARGVRAGWSVRGFRLALLVTVALTVSGCQTVAKRPVVAKATPTCGSIQTCLSAKSQFARVSPTDVTHATASPEPVAPVETAEPAASPDQPVVEPDAKPLFRFGPFGRRPAARVAAATPDTPPTVAAAPAPSMPATTEAHAPSGWGLPPPPPVNTASTGSLPTTAGSPPASRTARQPVEDDALVTASLPPAAKKAPRGKEPDGPSMSLADAVSRSIGVHPQVDEARAKVDEAKSAVSGAKAPTRPQIDLRVGTGHASAPVADELFRYSNPDAGNARVDMGVSLRALVYDFGASREEIARTMRMLDVARLREYDKVEEIGLKVTQAYLRILEARELLAAAEEAVAGLRMVSRLVNENTKNGNGTLADVKRVEARLIDAEAQRADLNSEMQSATDQFRRLARIEPGRLSPAPLLSRSIPDKVDVALADARRQHPRLLATESARLASEHERNGQRRAGMPKITAEADAQTRGFHGEKDRGEGDLRAMMVMRYKLMDGGLNRAEVQQSEARVRQNEAKLRDQEDEIEADIRQFYRAISSARAKYASLGEGVDASRKVVGLYVEQFRNGQRTLFELLDAQTALMSARRSLIEAQYSERRAVYGILRSVGRLTPTIVGSAAAARPASEATTTRKRS
jgi:TolC family type I secretion outer membrane protein